MEVDGSGDLRVVHKGPGEIVRLGEPPYRDRFVTYLGLRKELRERCPRAEYFDLEQRVTLIGNARVWEEDNVVSGDTITLYIAQDRSIVQGGKQERVKAVFYAKETEKQNGEAAPKRTAESCKN